jgi:hypothetical protein
MDTKQQQTEQAAGIAAEARPSAASQTREFTAAEGQMLALAITEIADLCEAAGAELDGRGVGFCRNLVQAVREHRDGENAIWSWREANPRVPPQGAPFDAHPENREAKERFYKSIRGMS